MLISILIVKYSKIFILQEILKPEGADMKAKEGQL